MRFQSIRDVRANGLKIDGQKVVLGEAGTYVFYEEGKLHFVHWDVEESLNTDEPQGLKHLCKLLSDLKESVSEPDTHWLQAIESMTRHLQSN